MRAYTRGSAHANGLDDVTGTIEEGRPADLVLLDRDPRDARRGCASRTPASCSPWSTVSRSGRTRSSAPRPGAAAAAALRQRRPCGSGGPAAAAPLRGRAAATPRRLAALVVGGRRCSGGQPEVNQSDTRLPGVRVPCRRWLPPRIRAARRMPVAVHGVPAVGTVSRSPARRQWRHSRASAPTCGTSSSMSSTTRGPHEPVPGISAAVVTPDDSWMGVTGKADLEPGARVEPDTPFSIGSVTKTFVATVILQLREEGKLSLDDHLSRWETKVPNASRITVRQLLSHTSGVRDMWWDPHYKSRVEGRPGHVWTYARGARHDRPVPVPTRHPIRVLQLQLRAAGSDHHARHRPQRRPGDPDAVAGPARTSTTPGTRGRKTDPARWPWATCVDRAAWVPQGDGTGLRPTTSIATFFGAAGAMVSTAHGSRGLGARAVRRPRAASRLARADDAVQRPRLRSGYPPDDDGRPDRVGTWRFARRLRDVDVVPAEARHVGGGHLEPSGTRHRATVEGRLTRAGRAMPSIRTRPRRPSALPGSPCGQVRSCRPDSAPVVVTWSAAQDSQGSVTGYQLRRRSGTEHGSPVRLASTTARHATHDPHATGTTTVVAVRAVDDRGNASDWVESAPVRATFVDESDGGSHGGSRMALPDRGRTPSVDRCWRAHARQPPDVPPPGTRHGGRDPAGVASSPRLACGSTLGTGSWHRSGRRRRSPRRTLMSWRWSGPASVHCAAHPGATCGPPSSGHRRIPRAGTCRALNQRRRPNDRRPADPRRRGLRRRRPPGTRR